jgi:uncharacterized protein YqgV (UPF0045/DUF77 family)
LTGKAFMLVEIQVLPNPTGTADAPYGHVDAAIARIAGSGIRYEVGALGTTIEGTPDQLWPLLRAAHEAALAAGAGQVVTVIKVAESSLDDAALTIEHLTAHHREQR